MSWVDARLPQLGRGRLPTEAEWEAFAAPTGALSWGNAFSAG
jgi:formylglycine-generating enzyme required for sulfatase activity